MNNQKRITFLVLPLSLLLLLGGVLFLLDHFGLIKSPLRNIPILQKEPKVSVKTEYKNPFDKKTQFVNPFDQYKNPFVVNR